MDWNKVSFRAFEQILEQMTNLKSLELDGDPYWIDEDGGITTRPYPLDRFKAIRGLEKLKLKFSDVNPSIEACGSMILGLLSRMPKLIKLKIEFFK